MITDVELEIWREEWQTEEAVPDSLRKNVERQSRLMKIGLVSDVVVTVILGGGTTAWAFLSSDSSVVLVAVATWLFLAAAWIFVLITNRGLWTPAALDASAYLELSIRRCRSALHTVWFAAGLFVAEVAFGLSWGYLHLESRKPALQWLAFSSIRMDVVWILTTVFFASLLWYRAKKRSELEQLVRMREETDGAKEIRASLS